MCILYCVLSCFIHQIATMQRVYVVGMQVIYIPLGIVIARLFHCSDAGMLNVDNSMQCWQVSICMYYVWCRIHTRIFKNSRICRYSVSCRTNYETIILTLFTLKCQEKTYWAGPPILLIYCRVPERWGLQQTHPGLRAATRHGVRDFKKKTNRSFDPPFY